MRPPSVDALARSVADLGLPHPVAVAAARAALAAGDPALVRPFAESAAGRVLRPVVNATGVLLHTNLGRAPLAPPAAGPASGGAGAPVRYANVELDLATGRRGSRQLGVSGLLTALTGADAALVVNNGAAAVLLVLAAHAADRAVLVSRGELVEIGGGFRIPDILRTSGARLVEVGTTNRTHLADYDAALGSDPALVLRVHRSNFAMTGFTAAPSLAELAALGVPVVADVGSGLLDAGVPWLAGPPPAWLAGEPAARQALGDGAALVTFSGDKLLGGPQAGIIVGRADLVAACARHPLARALRPGGLVLGALEATLAALAAGDGAAVPLWAMVSAPVADLRRRARAVAHAVGDAVGGAGEAAGAGGTTHPGVVAPVDLDGAAGGGAVPGGRIPSAGVAVAGDHRLALLRHDPPVVAYVSRGRTVIDLRTVDPVDDAVVTAGLAAVLTGLAQTGEPSKVASPKANTPPSCPTSQ